MTDTGLPQLDDDFSLDDLLDHYMHVDVPMPFAKPGETPKHTREDFSVAVVDAFVEQFPNEREAIGIVIDPRYGDHIVIFRMRKRLIAKLDLQKLGDRIEALLAERTALVETMKTEASDAVPGQD